MKNMLCFLFWSMVAYTIFFLSYRWELYALENWGIRAALFLVLSFIAK